MLKKLKYLKNVKKNINFKRKSIKNIKKKQQKKNKKRNNKRTLKYFNIYYINETNKHVFTFSLKEKKIDVL